MTAQLLELQFDSSPELVYKSHHEYRTGKAAKSRPCANSNFLKGAKWSPDGACLLTAAEDNWLRVYDLPPEALEQPGLQHAARKGINDDVAALPDNLPAVLHVDEGETVYDYAWYPGMLASEPASCVFATTVRGHPIHLWDALSGQLRASYRAYNNVDEVTAAYCLAFGANGGRIFAGFNKMLRVFDVGRPGRAYREIVTHKREAPGLQGIVSCLAANPDRSGMLAAGAYSGDTGIFDEGTGELLYVLQGQKGGITQVQFSRDGNFLYCGARRDGDIFCWDVRYASDVVYRLERESGSTNQRIHFDIEPCGRHLASGGTDGALRVFDLREGTQAASFQLAGDTLNGVQFHPFLPLLATASGHRQFPLQPGSDTDSDADDGSAGVTCSQAPCALQTAACIWRLECRAAAAEEAPAVGDKIEDAAAVDDAPSADADEQDDARIHAPEPQEDAMQVELPAHAAAEQASHAAAVGSIAHAQGAAEEPAHAAANDEAMHEEG